MGARCRWIGGARRRLRLPGPAGASRFAGALAADGARGASGPARAYRPRDGRPQRRAVCGRRAGRAIPRLAGAIGRRHDAEPLRTGTAGGSPPGVDR
ncbi:hypothetical protein G6F32_016448 [Rhizopus arrhizus]|nr:hypothetical protein G6F32_016448 [Rhizopus arrhizus]